MLLILRPARTPVGACEGEGKIPMLLQNLLEQYDSSLARTGLPKVEVRGVREDSRCVQPGDLFIARPGGKTDGARFIADAKARGAVAVVTQSAIAGAPLPQVIAKDIASAASVLANVLYGRPSETLRVLGV